MARATTDVTIYGAGIFGLSVAWHLTQRGALVTLIDPTGPASGASGGLVGALAPHVPENWNAKKAFQLDSLLMAEAFWSDVEQTSGKGSGYGRLGRLQPILDERALELALKRTETARTYWDSNATWSVRPTSEFDGWCPPSPTGYVIHDTLSARIHPRQACATLVAALKAKGAQFVESAPERGSVVHASGYHGLLDLGKVFNSSVGNGVKGQAALLNFDARKMAQIYVDGLHLIPHADGTLAIGSTSEREFQDESSTNALLDDVIARAQAAMPQIREATVLERWAGVRPRAKSRAPMLGEWPGRPGHYIANGGFKIGFGMAPKIGAVMADLILEGKDCIPKGFRVENNL